MTERQNDRMTEWQRQQHGNSTATHRSRRPNWHFQYQTRPQHRAEQLGQRTRRPVASRAARWECRHWPKYEEALRIDREGLPHGHTSIAIDLGGIGLVLHKLGRNDEALAKLEEALATFKAKLPPTHPYIIVMLQRLVPVLEALGRADDAAAAAAEAAGLEAQRDG